MLATVADAAKRDPSPTAGSVVVTVVLPKFGPPPMVAVKAVRVDTSAIVGTGALSKVLTNRDGSQYIVARLNKLPLADDLSIGVAAVSEGLVANPSLVRLIMFRPVGKGISFNFPVTLTAAVPSTAVTFVPVDLETLPPPPRAIKTPGMSSPSPAPSPSPT